MADVLLTGLTAATAVPSGANVLISRPGTTAGSLVFGLLATTALTGAAGPAGPTGATGATGPAGPTGATGAAILSGNGAPANTLGANGDSYVDTTSGGTGAVYRKASGAWTVVAGASLRGPVGATGPTGATGATGPAGTGTGTAARTYRTISAAGAYTVADTEEFILITAAAAGLVTLALPATLTREVTVANRKTDASAANSTVRITPSAPTGGGAARTVEGDPFIDLNTLFTVRLTPVGTDWIAYGG